MPAPHQPDLPLDFRPKVYYPTVTVPQPDGSVVMRPGRPVVLSGEIRVSKFAELTGLSISRVNVLCVEGIIPSRRLSPAPRSPYLIPRDEVSRFLSERKIARRS